MTFNRNERGREPVLASLAQFPAGYSKGRCAARQLPLLGIMFLMVVFAAGCGSGEAWVKTETTMLIPDELLGRWYAEDGKPVVEFRNSSGRGEVLVPSLTPSQLALSATASADTVSVRTVWSLLEGPTIGFTDYDVQSDSDGRARITARWGGEIFGGEEGEDLGVLTTTRSPTVEIRGFRKALARAEARLVWRSSVWSCRRKRAASFVSAVSIPVRAQSRSTFWASNFAGARTDRVCLV